jgi:hypothetical protein
MELRNVYINLIAKCEKNKIPRRHVHRWDDAFKVELHEMHVDQSRLVEGRT